jgi:hypothetical protein
MKEQKEYLIDRLHDSLKKLEEKRIEYMTALNEHFAVLDHLTAYNNLVSNDENEISDNLFKNKNLGSKCQEYTERMNNLNTHSSHREVLDKMYESRSKNLKPLYPIIDNQEKIITFLDKIIESGKVDGFIKCLNYDPRMETVSKEYFELKRDELKKRNNIVDLLSESNEIKDINDIIKNVEHINLNKEKYYKILKMFQNELKSES